MALRLKAGKVPNEAVSLTNRVALNPRDHGQLGNSRHVAITLPSGQTMRFTVQVEGAMKTGEVGFSAPQRKWGGIDVNSDLSVSPFDCKDLISSMTVDVLWEICSTTCLCFTLFGRIFSTISVEVL